jgi:hypothetical protein
LLLRRGSVLLRWVTTLLLRRGSVLLLLLGRVTLTVTALLLTVALRSAGRRGELVLALVTVLLRSTICGSSTLRTVRLFVLGIVRGIDCSEDQLEDLYEEVNHCSGLVTDSDAYPEIGSEINRGVSACHLGGLVLEV